MEYDEHYGQPDEQATSSTGLSLALIVGAAVVVLLVLCGGGLAFFWMAREAEMEVRVAEVAAMEADEGALLAKAAAAKPMEVLPRLDVAKAADGPPLTPQRLNGARLESVARPPQIEWQLTGERFILRIDGSPAPKLLLDTLLGTGKSATRIEGRWKLSEDGSNLQLLDVTADGRPGAKFAGLIIRPDGQTRVYLVDRLYDLVPVAIGKAPKKD